jgi:hypothetical protein
MVEQWAADDGGADDPHAEHAESSTGEWLPGCRRERDQA